MLVMMMKDDLCQKWRVELIFQGTYRLSGTGIVECLKIIDVGCNLKQFDAEADRKMQLSFSAVNENADENEIPFSAKKKTKTKVTCADITELSYGSVANITFSAQRK